MTPYRISRRSWKTRSMKLSIYIGWRVSHRNMCLHYRVWLIWSNIIVELRKSVPWQKTKTLPSCQTSNRGWTNAPRCRKEWNVIPWPYMMNKGQNRVGHPPAKGSYNHRGEILQPPTTIHLKGNKTFRGP